MARLFITPREIHLINDWTKEFVKDVVGQYITYYPISILKTRVHPVYDEAVEKIFDHPIKMDCLVSQPERGQALSKWAIEGTNKIEVLVQARDLLDKGFQPEAGDFFVYGDEVFEVLETIEIGDIFGQAEYNVYFKLNSKLVRSGRFDIESFQKLLEDKKDFQESQVQKVFEQQRGLSENTTDGALGDVRQVRDRLADDMEPIALGEGPRQVNPEDEEDTSDTTGDDSASSFYNE
jgi:hypothetical protein